MKHLRLFLCAWLMSTLGPIAGADGLLDPLAPLYTDAPRATTGHPRYTTHVARGQTAWVHLLTASPAQTPSIQTPKAFNNTAVTIDRLVAVPVEQNTGLHSRTEIFERRNNPFVIRDAPFAVYEVLAPHDAPLVKNQHQPTDRSAFALRLPVPIDIPPGEYTLTITTSEGDQYLWTLHVHPAVLDKNWRRVHGFTNWLHTANLQKWHGTGWFDDAYFHVLGQYAALMHTIGQNTVPIPVTDLFVIEAGKPQLKTKLATRWLQTFQQAMGDDLAAIELMHCVKRPSDDWTAPHVELWLTGNRADSPEGIADLDAMYQQLAEWLRPQALRGVRLYAHIADEPTKTNADAYRKVAEQVKRHLPTAKIFDATLNRSLGGAIDAWCPQAHRWALNKEFFDVRKALGDEVWFYTCLEPGGPWLNRLLDQERTRVIYLHWAAFRFGLDGYLHWALNHWMTDPYETSALKHPYDRNPRNWLPAGDTHIVYPPTRTMLDAGHTAPLTSVRAEAHRQGMQDAALLSTLAQTRPTLAATLANELVSQMDDYRADVASYHAVRQKLLNALSQTP